MIKVGDRLPNATFTVMGEGGPQPKTTDDIFKGKKVALFAVPGAFTPTCSAAHLPGFRDNADALKAKGVDSIACVAVNDVFVMNAWGKDQKVDGKVEMLADGSGKFADALGLTVDLNERGLGVRSKRYSMLVDDGVVKSLNIEPGPGTEVSGAEAMLKQL
jgi:peroxiredoxin